MHEKQRLEGRGAGYLPRGATIRASSTHASGPGPQTYRVSLDVCTIFEINVDLFRPLIHNQPLDLALGEHLCAKLLPSHLFVPLLPPAAEVQGNQHNDR